MTTDRTNPTGGQRRDDREREDGELGFTPALATRLHTAMAEEVDGVTAPAEMYDDVRARRDRRRWFVRGGLALAGAAAVAATVVGVIAVTPDEQVTPDIAETPSGETTPTPAPSPDDASHESSPSSSETSTDDASADPSATASASDGDGDPSVGDGTGTTADTVTLTVGTGATTIPRFELEAGDDGVLRLVERASDGTIADTSEVLTVDGASLSGVWVRPGSTRADLTAVLTDTRTSDGLAETTISTLRVVDGEPTLTTWPDALQASTVAGDASDVTPRGGDWAPDGSGFAIAIDARGGSVPVPSQQLVVGWDDGPTGGDTFVTDGQPIVEWADNDDPDTDGTEFELWLPPLGDSGGLTASTFVRRSDGTVERTDEDAGVAYDAPPPSGGGNGRFYAVGGSVQTPVGIVDSVSLVDMGLEGGAGAPEDQLFVRLLRDGELLASLPVDPAVGFTTGARLSTLGGEPVVAIDTLNATLVVRPTAEGTIADLVRLDAPPRTQNVDFID